MDQDFIEKMIIPNSLSNSRWFVDTCRRGDTWVLSVLFNFCFSDMFWCLVSYGTGVLWIFHFSFETAIKYSSLHILRSFIATPDVLHKKKSR